MNEVDVSIIFVNYKTSTLLKDVISSIKEKSHDFSYEIIVVDNSQNDLEFNKLLENKEATIIDAKGNLGFGKANNLGASEAKGKYLYFLNTDTLLINNAIYELKKYLDENDNVAIVGSNLYTQDLRPNFSFDIKEKNLKNDKNKNRLSVCCLRYLFHYRKDFNFTDSPIEINGFVCGASLMIRKSEFDKLGGFDKDIFMYAEEALLCYRVINELHKKIYNIPCSKIIHLVSGGAQISSNYYKMSIDGNYLYYSKLFGQDKAKKYLYNEYKNSKRNQFLFKILRKKDKVTQFKTYCNLLELKIQHINKCLN